MTVDTAVPRSRRALLAAAVGGLAGLAGAALGRPDRADAAAGDNLKLGQNNDSGTSQTVLANAGLGAAFTLKTTNVSTNATGIFGWTSQTGVNATRGVYGKADGDNSYGVYGRQSGPEGEGAAVFGEGNQNDGLVGTSNHPDHNGVKGYAPGTGVYGEATSTTGETAGVFGVAVSDDPQSAGVIGLGSDQAVGLRGIGDIDGVIGTSNADGFGVFGNAPNGGGVGGSSSIGPGVQGLSTSGDGVLGVSTSSNGVAGASTSGTGVLGQTTTGFAGYFLGPVSVVGVLTKSSGAFKIDHPLDPAAKYLSHSFVESPDMKNVYDGVVALDSRGEATVQLPSYFEALNRDTRVQLTAMGAAAPDLHVESKVAKGRFRIAGGRAGQEVCWQVTGIRQDAFAEVHPIVVEEAKPAAERGLYLHPDLYGQPEQKGLDWQHRPREMRRPAAS